jgi:cell division initiation protein
MKHLTIQAFIRLNYLWCAKNVKGVNKMLTPADIENAEFKLVARGKGYDRDEVDDFLDIVIVEYEKLLKDNVTLSNKINVMNDAIQHYRQMEDTLKSSIVKGEQAAEDTRQNAFTQADQIVNEAKQKATQIIDRANNEQYKIELETNRLKAQFETLRGKMKTLLNSELELIENAAPDFKTEDAE